MQASPEPRLVLLGAHPFLSVKLPPTACLQAVLAQRWASWKLRRQTWKQRERRRREMQL